MKVENLRVRIENKQKNFITKAKGCSMRPVKFHPKVKLSYAGGRMFFKVS